MKLCAMQIALEVLMSFLLFWGARRKFIILKWKLLSEVWVRQYTKQTWVRFIQSLDRFETAL